MSRRDRELRGEGEEAQGGAGEGGRLDRTYHNGAIVEGRKAVRVHCVLGFALALARGITVLIVVFQGPESWCIFTLQRN